MQKLPILKSGDSVEIVAPASRCSDILLEKTIHLLKSCGLNCIVDENLFGKDLICANTDEIRLDLLKKAFLRPETKAIICARGGYGSMRLLPKLGEMTPPSQPKLFIGMSDITALNLFLENHWQWPTLHAGFAFDKFTESSIAALKTFLFGEAKETLLNGIALNSAAKKEVNLETTITGGNLCIVQTSIGTSWQIQGKNKILFLEDVGERGYRVDRMLEHLRQAGVFENVSTILFGDFTEGKEPDGSSLIAPVLQRFAESCVIPVIQVAGLGHGSTNYPLPLGSHVKLRLGNEITLSY